MYKDQSFCFVDLETTGTQAHWDKIIEIGILKVQGKRIVKTYKQLLNPQAYVDPFIENLTGINAKSLQDAPTFEEVKDEIFKILEDSVFVAHNARFDYGFLRNEFKRTGTSFRSKHLCTIKLSRLLYPKLGRYNLDKIIDHLKISCKNRHRAFDDAKVLWELFQKAHKEFGEEKLQKAIDCAMKRPSIPSAISDSLLESLPESPGVYIFYGENKTVLYVGKSLNVYDRVLSHFSNDYQSTTDMKLQTQVKHIEAIPTAGELGALLLESKLIKIHMPLYNRMLRHARKMVFLLKDITDTGYQSVRISEQPTVEVDEIPQVLGVFKSQRQVKDFLHKIAKEKSLCPKLLNVEKTKKGCFNFHLAYCKGACVGKESPLCYNLRFEEAFFKNKIKPWRFEKAIVISEVGDFEEHFIIDKWCYLGSFKSQEEYWEGLSQNYFFDLDTYRIISKFIENPRNYKKFSINKFSENYGTS